MKIAHVSTFPAMKCGIAFYASDVIEALPMCEHSRYALHYGTNLTDQVAGHANVSKPSDLRELAKVISRSQCDVVSLQHEFGIWGGLNGEHIFEFLDELSKPIVTTLHTTFMSGRRPAIQRSILRRLIEQSAVAFALTARSRDTLCMTLGVKQAAVAVIPHGVPNVTFEPPSNWWLPDAAAGGCRLCSIGFFRPDKGLETILRALRQLKGLGRRFEYLVSGEPQGQFEEQAQYLRDIRTLVAELDLADCVQIDARFLTRDEQVQLIRTSHAGVFAYQDPDHASSGAIPLVMAAGRPVICTPFEFAVAKKREVGSVTLAEGFGAAAMADAIDCFFGSTATYRQETELLYERTRPWTWRTVGGAYAAAFNEALVRRTITEIRD